MAGEVVGSARIVIEPDMSGFNSALSGDLLASSEQAAADMERVFTARSQAAARSISDIADGFGDVTSEISRVDQQLSLLDTELEVTVLADGSDIDQLERELRPLTEEEQQVLVDAEIAAAQQKIRQIDRQLQEDLDDEEVRILLDQRGEASRRMSDLSEGAEELEEDLDGAADAGSNLTRILAGIGFAAVAKGLFEIAKGASDLEQAIGGTETLFEEASGTIDDFAETSAMAFGLSGREARELTSQLGGLLLGFDYTKQAAAETSVEIAKLGADLAAAYGGEVPAAVDALSAALRGQFDPLERFGVALNVAQIEAHALETGLAASKGEIDLSMRATAALSLIQERTSNIQGQFTRELTTAGGVMATTRATLSQLATAAGTELLPGLIALSETLRDQAAPALFELAKAALPLVTTALEAFSPLLGVTADLLVTMAPAIELVVDLIGLVPDPLLAATGAFIAFNRAADTLTKLGIGKALAGAATGTGLLARSAGLLKAHPYLAAAAGVTAIGVAAFRSGGNLGDFAEGISSTFQSFLGLETRAEQSAKALAAFTDGLDLSSIGGMETAIERANEAADSFDHLGGEIQDVILNDSSFADALDELNSQLKENVASQLEAAAASGALDEAFKRELAVLVQSNAGHEEYVDLLRRATPAIQAHEQNIQEAVEAHSELATMGQFTAESMDNLLHSSGGVSVALLNLKSGAGNADEQLMNLALSIGEGAEAEEQMAELAQVLGVELEALEGFVEDVNGAIDDFVNNATSNLPTVQDAFRDLNEDGKVSAREFIESLQADTMAIQEFHANLAVIQEAGFAQLAATIAQKGPEIGGAMALELATAAQQGGEALLLETEAAVNASNAAYAGMEEYLRTELGPQFILTNGLLGSAATAAFGANLTFAQRINLAGSIARLEMSEEGKAIAAIAAVEGEDAARAYGQGLGLDEEVIEEGVKAGNALRNIDTSGASAGGASTGAAFAQGVSAGMLGAKWGVLAQAQSIANEARNIIDSVWGVSSPSRVMMYSGRMFGEGLAVGIESEEDAVVAAAENIARLAAESGQIPTISTVGNPPPPPASVAAQTAASNQALAQTLISANQTSPTVVEFNINGGNDVVAAIVQELRRQVTISGGDVQTFLGGQR